ncbi:hypothetical protein ACFQX6_55125 [Streptosporangium lutulentum]
MVQDPTLRAEGRHVDVVAQAPPTPNQGYRDAIKLEESLTFVVRNDLDLGTPLSQNGSPEPALDPPNIGDFTRNFPSAPVLVPERFLAGGQGGSAEVGTGTLQSAEGSNPDLDTPGFDGAALVPPDDSRIDDQLKKLGEVPVVPVKYVLVSDGVSEPLNAWLRRHLRQLNPDAVQEMAMSKNYAQEAAGWVDRLLGPAPSAATPTPSLGFSLPQAALALLAAGSSPSSRCCCSAAVPRWRAPVAAASRAGSLGNRLHPAAPSSRGSARPSPSSGRSRTSGSWWAPSPSASPCTFPGRPPPRNRGSR